MSEERDKVESVSRYVDVSESFTPFPAVVPLSGGSKWGASSSQRDWSAIPEALAQLQA